MSGYPQQPWPGHDPTGAYPGQPQVPQPQPYYYVDPRTGQSYAYAQPYGTATQQGYPQQQQHQPPQQQGPQGTPFGPYVLESELGRGGMGVVYKAYHRDLKRSCALKMLQAQGEDDEAKKRFVREGQASAKLGKHPNIVQVFDAGMVDGTPYIAMELVSGTALDGMLEKGPLPAKQVLELGRKVALALDHAHGCGIVHRDMKPQNVIIDKAGEPQVLDFGLAKDVSNAAQLSRVNAIMGTPAYMSPEQAQPGTHQVDRRSDVYSLAATLHHCLSGKPPFGGDDAVQTIVKVVFTDPPALSKLYGVDPDIEAIIERAMEKDPKNRYQSALELADDLSRAMNGEAPRARSVGPIGRTWRRIRRNRGAFALVSLAGLGLVGLSFWAVFKTAEAGQAMIRRNKAAGIIGSMQGNENAEEKIQKYTAAKDADPSWDRAYFQLAVAHSDRALEADAESHEIAREHRRKALEALDEGFKYGLGAIGHFQRATVLEELQLFQPMRDALKAAIALEPTSEIGLEAQCALALHERRYDDAERLGTDVLRMNEGSDITLWRRGEARLRLGKHALAHEDAVRAAELWETEPEYYILAARAQMAMGKHDGWAKHLLEARGVNPDHPRLAAELALDAVRRGNLARAERLANEAIRLDDLRPVFAPNDRRPTVYVARARVRLAAGKEEEALADLVRALEVDPLQPDAAHDQACLKGEYPAPGDSADADSLVRAAHEAFERGAADQALQLAKRVLARSAKRADALELGVRSLLIKDRADDAVALLAGADAPHLLALRAWANERAGKAAAAEADAKAALAGRDQPALALRVRAASRIRAGDEELALIDVQRALRVDPFDVVALEIKAKCLDAIHDPVGAQEVRELIAWLVREEKPAPAGGANETPAPPG